MDEEGDKNNDHRVPPEIDSEVCYYLCFIKLNLTIFYFQRYVIHSLRRHAYLHIQINSIVEDDPFEAIEGHFESDSDSDNDENNDDEAQPQNDDNEEEVDIRDGVPAQNIDDVMINAVAEGLIGNDDAPPENLERP